MKLIERLERNPAQSGYVIGMTVTVFMCFALDKIVVLSSPQRAAEAFGIRTVLDILLAFVCGVCTGCGFYLFFKNDKRKRGG